VAYQTQHKDYKYFIIIFNELFIVYRNVPYALQAIGWLEAEIKKIISCDIRIYKIYPITIYHDYQ